jgi:hypothetical protein
VALQRLHDDLAGGLFVRRGDGVFEVQDQAIGPALAGLGDHCRAVAWDIEQAAPEAAAGQRVERKWG